MNSVEIVKSLCKEKKIAISKLERELGFSNGYIGQLRKGSFPTDRLVLIANYLGVSTDYILTGGEKEPAAPKNDGLSEKDIRLIGWFRSLPEEKQKAILTSQDAPEGLV